MWPSDKPLDDEMIAKLMERVDISHKHNDVARQQAQERNFPETMRRKRQSYMRWKIWQGKIAPYVAQRVDTLYERKKIRDSIKRYVTDSFSPARDVVRSVCQVYKQTPRRVVGRKGGGKKRDDALQLLYKRSKWDKIAPTINCLAYFVGPLQVIPRPSKTGMGFDVLMPHDYDAVLDEDDPCGSPPSAIAFTIPQESADVCIIDASGWRYFKLTNGSGFEEVPSMRRAYSWRTVEEVRVDVPLDVRDYYSSDVHNRIVECGIEIGLCAALMGHVRKTQNKYLLTVTGDTANLPKGQDTGDPEGAVILPTARGQGPSTLQAQALPFDVDPANFLRQIRIYLEVMAESTGVQVVNATSQNGQTIDVEFSYDGLNELRNAQVPFFRDFEMRLAQCMVRWADEKGYEGRYDLPTPEQIEAGFRVDFGKLSRRFDDPDKEMRYKDWEIKYGLESPLGLLRPKHPEASDEELKAIQDENMEETSKWNDEITKRNMALGGNDPGIVTAAQANGAAGAQAKNDGKRAAADQSGSESGNAAAGR